MKLDATAIRYLSPEEFRVLTAVEMGSKNHTIVPTQLIAQISGLRSGGVNKILGELLKRKLVARDGGKKTNYDGFRLAYGGYDYLAIRSMSKRDTMVSVGNQIGTGKESDIYVVADAEGEERVMKIHRLGRVSFRSIKTKRDYLRKGQSSGNWMYLSRLAATKEYAFMNVLHAHGFPVPKPYDHSRHCLLMELIPSFPLRQVSTIPHDEVPLLYSKLMDLIVRLANCGLIHGDFNEFNLLVKERDDGGVEPILIDFPQMVSTEHENAEFYFNRDVECIRKFFKKRFNYESKLWPRFSSVLKEGKREFELDVEVEASGWKGGKEGKVLEEYIRELEEREGEKGSDDDSNEEEEESDEKGKSEQGEEDDSDLEKDQEKDVHDISRRRRSLSESTNSLSSQARSLTHSNSSSSERPRAPKEMSSSLRIAKDEVGRTRDGDKGVEEMKSKVAKEVKAQKERETRKFHSKKGAARTVGRRKGSKMKSDKRNEIGGY